jgi:hypothetical protein
MDINISDADIVVVGGGSAGSTAAIAAQRALPQGRVVLLEKAHIKRSGAIAIGMDGLNNAVIPGHATPEQYVKEITMANDGIVNQVAVLAYALRSYAMIEELDRWGVKFQKTATGDYDVKKVHHMGSYVLPMPEGYDLKKILSRLIKRAGVRIENRVMATRILVDRGRVAGVIGLDVRDGSMAIVRAKAVILCCGASGRLGLPASGYLYGTYENPSNAGDGYSMAYHAGAELTGIECFQINPLIKDYNGPACAYVTGPLGGHTVNARGHRFIENDYWSGQMMLEFYRELHSESGPVYLSSPISRRRRSPRSSACSTAPSAPVAAAFTPVEGTGIRAIWWRCTSPRLVCAAATAGPACGSTRRAKPRCPASTRPATWPACRTTTCSAPSPTVRFARKMRCSTLPALAPSRPSFLEMRWTPSATASSGRSPAPRDSLLINTNTRSGASSTTTSNRRRRRPRWRSV